MGPTELERKIDRLKKEQADLRPLITDALAQRDHWQAEVQRFIDRRAAIDKEMIVLLQESKS